MSDFGFAIDALKAGYKVRRSGWDSPMELELTTPIPSGVKSTIEQVFTYPYLTLITVTDTLPWAITQTDVLSEDWEIV